MLNRFNKPEYIYRPQQILRRLTQFLQPEPTVAEIELPWRLTMSVRPSDDIGRAVWCSGVYDLPLTEAVWRLLDAGETAIDVGANTGYVAGLMAARSGASGLVLAFEPHPINFAALTSNIGSWANRAIAPIRPLAIALSSTSGTGFLEEPPGFERNCGLARVAKNIADVKSARPTVGLSRLDEILSDSDVVGLLKIDVEGYELEVLAGSRGLLEKQLVRDIIFEDHSWSSSSPVSALLADFGYTVFALGRRFTGPILLRLNGVHTFSAHLPPNFLATTDPIRAVARFQDPGWRVFQATAS